MFLCQMSRYSIHVIIAIAVAYGHIQPLTVIFVSFQATLKTICDHANNVSLAHSRKHRHRKRKHIDKQSGSFGDLPKTPAKKGKGHDNNDDEYL